MAKKEEYLIDFPEYIITKNFEKSFKDHYHKSTLSKNEEILLDFSNVDWCDLFEICLITLWINELKNKDKKIRCRLPKNKVVYRFLEKFEFVKFLEDKSIEIEQGNLYESKEYCEYDYIQSITFFPEEGNFHDFIESLEDEKTQRDLFKDLYDLDIISSGGMRDIIINEIGQNMFDHAEGKGALMAMGVIRKPQKTKLPKFEEGFFKSLKKTGSGYLQIVICDHGDGFKKVLGSTYEEDESIPIDERKNPTELRIIEYAFEKTSTSKEEKPLSEIAEDEDYEKLIPPKGLYFVKELLKKRKGFLSVRSGNSILCYDFLSGNKVKVCTSQDDASLKLANFRGVQYKLFIPTNPDHEIISRKIEGIRASLVGHKIPKTYRFYYIPVKDYLLDHTQLDLDRIFTDIKKVSNELKDKGITVLDFSNTDLKKQYLYPLIKKIIFLQEEKKLIIGFNLGESEGVAETVSDCIIEDKEFSRMREKIFVWIDDRLNMNFIGVEDECLDLYLDYQKEVKGVTDKRLKLLLEHSEHFLWYDQQEQRYYEKFQIRDFLESLAVYKIKNIRERILDENNKILYRGKFLIPSVTYAEAFYEINRLYSEFEDREKLINTLAYLYILNHIEFSTIVTASDIAGRIAEDFINKIKHLRGEEYEELKHFKLIYEKPTIGYEFTILKENEKILLLTDVIGTAKSIGRHIEKILVSNTKLKIENISTFTIVDAREGEEGDKEEEFNCEGIHRDKFYFEPKNPEIKQAGICELCSLLKWPIKYHLERPPDWDYKDIIVIDPKTHSPIWESQESLQKIKDGRNFLKEYCLDAVITKHLNFDDDGGHYNYFFLTNIIAERFKERIAIKVDKDVKTLQKRQVNGKFITPNIKVLWGKREINKRIAEAIAERLNLRPSQDVWNYDQISKSMLKEVDVIVFDVAAGAGNTLKKTLIDIVASPKEPPRVVYAYVMINRMKELDTSFFGEINQFGKVECSVKFLMDFELPKYDNEDLCPICKKRKELIEVRKTTEVKAIREYIDEEIKRLQPQKTTFSEIDELTPASKEFNIEERVEKLAIRIELEKARRYENVEIRCETINKYLKSFSDNPDDVFDLFEIISEEEHYFKDDFKDSAGLFYPDLKERIVKTCLKIAKDEINYNERGVKYALSVLNIFSPRDFFDNLIPIFKKVIGENYSEKLGLHFFVEILNALSQEENRVQRTQMVKNLIDCRDHIEKENKLEENKLGVLRELCEELSIEKKGVIVKSIQYLYRRLISPLSPEHTEMIKEFRRFQGFYRTFVRSKTRGGVDEGTIKNIQSWAMRWEKIFLELTHIMENAKRILYEIGVSMPYFDPSDQRRPTMESDLSLLQEKVPKLQEGKYSEAIILEISEIVDRINSYVLNKDSSLQQVIKSLHSNILEELEAKMREREEEFCEKNIKIALPNSPFSHDIKVILPQSDLANILGNLFKDAINHGFEDVMTRNKKIVISLTEQKENILLEFADNGKGMSNEERNRIFEKGKEDDRKYWHEAKEIIEKFGGSITVNSEIGKGTMFRIRLLRG